MLEYDFDIGRAVASIIVNGVMFRYPNITFITVHSGGTVPMLVGRMKDRVPAASQQYLPNGLYAEVRKWYFDVAHATFPWPFAAGSSYDQVTVSVDAPDRDEVAEVTRERASYILAVVAPFVSTVVMRFPPGSYAYVVVPVTGLVCRIMRPKSSYEYAVTF